jgi:preprotein translocase subunit SecD
MNNGLSLFSKSIKNLFIRHIKYSILFIIVFILGFSSGPKKPENSYNLNIKQIITSSNIETQSNYENGKALFPQYQYHGLPEDFLIKKSPDLSFSYGDIKSIEIDRMPFYFPDKLAYNVSISFHPLAGERLFAYTKQNVNEKVALEIDNKIFVIATILEPLRTKMVITVGNKTVKQIRSELSKICNNIIIGGGGEK